MMRKCQNKYSIRIIYRNPGHVTIRRGSLSVSLPLGLYKQGHDPSVLVSDTNLVTLSVDIKTVLQGFIVYAVHIFLCRK